MAIIALLLGGVIGTLTFAISLLALGLPLTVSTKMYFVSGLSTVILIILFGMLARLSKGQQPRRTRSLQGKPKVTRS